MDRSNGFANQRRYNGTGRQFSDGSYQQNPGSYEREFSRIGDDDFQDARDVNRFNRNDQSYYNYGTGRQFSDGSYQQNPGSYGRGYSRSDARGINEYNGRTDYGYSSPGLNVYDSQGNVRNPPPSTQGWR